MWTSADDYLERGKMFNNEVDRIINKLEGQDKEIIKQLSKECSDWNNAWYNAQHEITKQHSQIFDLQDQVRILNNKVEMLQKQNDILRQRLIINK